MYIDQIQKAFLGKKDQLNKWFVTSFQMNPIEAQICGIGVFIVVLGTLLLIALNLDAMILALMLSITLCGAVMAFITALALLKGEKIEESCCISVPMDTISNNLPDFSAMMIDLPDDRVIVRYAELSNIALAKPISPVSLKKMKAQGKKASLLKSDAHTHFCGELLQYHLFRLIYRFQRNMLLSMKLGQERKAEVRKEDSQDNAQAAIENRLISTPMMLSKTSVCPGERLWELVSGNRFSQLKSEQLFWQNNRLLLPDNTSVSLNYVVSSPIAGKEGYNVRLVKPMFFDIGITLIPIATSSLGVIPPGLNLSNEITETIRTFKYVVQMTADFDRLTSGNRQTDELKEWVRWLFRKLKRSLADAIDTPPIPTDNAVDALNTPSPPLEEMAVTTETPTEESDTASVAAPATEFVGTPAS